MAHKPKYAKQEPRRNTALKLLPLVLVAIVAVVLIVRSLGKGKPDDAPTTPPTTEETPPLEPVASATVGVQGDLLMHKPVITACTTENGGYDFESIFRYVAEYAASYDYSVANLETTLGGDNYPYQGYPDFNCPDEIVGAAKDAGIDMLLTANNHCSDTTTEGVLRTVKRVREMGLTPLGTQLSDEEPKYAVVDVGGIKVGGSEKIAVIGAGPAGLSCAYYLAERGYKPTVFEKNERPGGMLVYGIPSYKLEKDVVDAEIEVLRQMGVDIRCGVEVGRDITLDTLRREGYKAFYVAIGCQDSRSAGIPGEDTAGVMTAVDFLHAVAENETYPVEGRAVVIGGGNVAIDVARTSVRCGAAEVSMYCLEHARLRRGSSRGRR